METNLTQTNIDDALLAKINRLRSKYEYFDEYLEDKDLTDYRVLLRAYMFENKKFSTERDIDIILDSENTDTDATEILLLIRDLISSGRKDTSKIYIGALLHLNNASKWSDINFELFKDLINSMDPDNFMDSPSEEIEHVAYYHKLKEEDRIIFIKFLLLKVIWYKCKKTEFPPVLSDYIEEGIFNNGIEIVSKSTFNRYYKVVDNSNKVLNKLVAMLESYEDSIQDFFQIISSYHIDNYSSEHIKGLGISDNLAFKIPKYLDVDYEEIKSKADKIISSSRSNKTAKSISLEKVVLFLFLVRTLNDSSNNRIFISNNKLSKYLGDTKVVSAIRDAYVEEGVFTNKESAIIEIKSTSYDLSMSSTIEKYIVLSDPYLIKKLNDDLSLTQEYFVEDRLLLLDRVIDIIETITSNKKDGKRANLTQIFLRSGDISSIRNLLNIVVVLKSRVGGFKNKAVNIDLVEAFKYIDKTLAKKLYLCFRSRLLFFIKNFGNSSYLHFYVPSLDFTVEEDVRERIKDEEIYSESFINDKEKFDVIISEEMEKERLKDFKKFINKLMKYCKMNSGSK